MKVMILAGEASGDLHGAELAKALKSREPAVALSGLGGPRMAAAGVDLLFDPTTISTIGFVEALRHVRVLKRVQRDVIDALTAQRPDAVVLIDYAGFNLTIAAQARRLGIPVVYYICPAVWAWGRGRAKKVAERCTRLLSIFPFEVEIYRQAGANVTFVGNPLLDVVPQGLTRAVARERLAIAPQTPLIGLLPGSRSQEIRGLLPAMAGAAEILMARLPGAEFLLPRAPTIEEAELRTHLAGSPAGVRIVDGLTHEVMAAADLLIATSGTATLEAAILGTPTIIVYRTSPLTYFLGRRLLKIPYIGLPNVVAGRGVVPELLQDEASPARIAAEALAILDDEDRRETMRRDLARIRTLLGEPGAVARAADLVLATARETAKETVR